MTSIWNAVTDPFGLRRIAELSQTDPAAAAALLAVRRSRLTEAAAIVATVPDAALKGALQGALSPLRDALEHAAQSAGLS